jgi:hypothetical protein
VVEGLDRLLSDDDIEEDIETLSNINGNKQGCDETSNIIQDESMHIIDRTPAQEYNLFNTFEPAESQILVPKLDHSNFNNNDYSNFNEVSMQNNQISDILERTENLCDTSNNVITTSDTTESQVTDPLQHIYENVQKIHPDTSIYEAAQIQNEEMQVLSSISSLLQYLPEQVEKLVAECNNDSQVCIVA